MQRARFMRESAEQMPRFIHTVRRHVSGMFCRLQECGPLGSTKSCWNMV